MTIFPLAAAEDACAVVDHGCHHFCAALADGYECRCLPGYRLNLDLRTCSSNHLCSPLYADNSNICGVFVLTLQFSILVWQWASGPVKLVMD